MHHARVLIRQRHIRCAPACHVEGVHSAAGWICCQQDMLFTLACEAACPAQSIFCADESPSNGGRCSQLRCIIGGSGWGPMCRCGALAQGGQADRERAQLHGARGQPEAHRLCAQTAPLAAAGPGRNKRKALQVRPSLFALVLLSAVVGKAPCQRLGSVGLMTVEQCCLLGALEFKRKLDSCCCTWTGRNLRTEGGALLSFVLMPNIVLCAQHRSKKGGGKERGWRRGGGRR